MAKTQAEPIRDPKTDHLLTPENCVLVLIDYQPEQFSTITSAAHEDITLNAVALGKLAAAYDIPVVLSTVGVDMGVNQGTVGAIRDALGGARRSIAPGSTRGRTRTSARRSRAPAGARW